MHWLIIIIGLNLTPIDAAATLDECQERVYMHRMLNPNLLLACISKEDHTRAMNMEN